MTKITTQDYKMKEIYGKHVITHPIRSLFSHEWPALQSTVMCESPFYRSLQQIHGAMIRDPAKDRIENPDCNRT